MQLQDLAVACLSAAAIGAAFVAVDTLRRARRLGTARRALASHHETLARSATWIRARREGAMPPRLAVASGPRSATRAAAEHLDLATQAEEEALAVSSATDGDVEDLRSDLHAVAEQHRLMHHLLLSPHFSRERPPAHRPDTGSPP